MKRFKLFWMVPVGAVIVGLIVALMLGPNSKGSRSQNKQADQTLRFRSHLDHSAFFEQPFATGQEVTAACLRCHEESGREVMQSAHFLWLGDEVVSKQTGEKLRIGKKNLVNNFCIGIQGNWASCTRCHAGYGWEDDSFDFADSHNVDCLVCHDQSGLYRKAEAGNPAKDVDLRASAQSVGMPKRDNCGVCHHYGGGGLGVKHGDLDASLDNPDEDDDVHMGREGMTCIDCHGGAQHNIRGKAFSVSVNHQNGIGCTDCHAANPHEDQRLNSHAKRVACQACHIPTFANNVPTKMWWDWSKAGDEGRKEDVHQYLKIKGEFRYEQSVVPEYYWFNMTVDRYLAGDKVSESGPTVINSIQGSREDPRAQIWPFKVHRGKQPFDSVHRYLITPQTSGKGGYWHEFDWQKALQLGADKAGLQYSGSYEFTETVMYWPLSHMVLPKSNALQCADCHGPSGRMGWPALGYAGDPMKIGSHLQ